MGLIQPPPLSLKDAISRQADIYDVWVQLWGTRHIPSPPTFLGDDSYPYLTEPGIPDTIAGIAIGPESDVDRCWITTNPSKDVSKVALTDFLVREVSVDSPLWFTQPAKIAPPLTTDPDFGVVPSVSIAQSRGMFYVFANMLRSGGAFHVTSTEIPPTYLKEDFSAANLNVDPPAINARFSAPILHLRLLLRSGILVGTKRSPALWGNVNNDTVALVANTEAIIAQWPIYGRKNIAITLRADLVGDATNHVTFRIATLRTLNYGATVQEETVGRKTVTCDANGKAAANFHLCNPGASYLLIYATGDAAGVMNGWTATMED